MPLRQALWPHPPPGPTSHLLLRHFIQIQPRQSSRAGFDCGRKPKWLLLTCHTACISPQAARLQNWPNTRSQLRRQMICHSRHASLWWANLGCLTMQSSIGLDSKRSSQSDLHKLYIKVVHYHFAGQKLSKMYEVGFISIGTLALEPNHA